MNYSFNPESKNLPIGVFDSGVGGLTVLRSLQQILPNESFLYLGDTARLPYGIKSVQTIQHYAQQTTHFLIQQGIKCLIIACNTASSAALPMLQVCYPEIPVIGVVEPGAEAACQSTKNEVIGIIATETTVNGQSYQKTIKKILPSAIVLAQGCSLFVSLAEEGWVDDDITEAVAHRYLDPWLNGNKHQPDTLVLGCTHFPALKSTIRKVIGESITIIDSGTAIAKVVEQVLNKYQIQATNSANKAVRFFVTDASPRFGHCAKQFLGTELKPDVIEVVDLKHPPGPTQSRLSSRDEFAGSR